MSPSHAAQIARPGFRPCVRCAGLALALLAQSPLVAQTEDSFVDQVEVNVINLELQITRDGKPVSGVERDELALMVDDQGIAISNFARPELERQGPDELAPLVIVIDLEFLDPSLRAQLLTELVNALPHLMAGGRRAMVATLGAELRVEQELTLQRPAVSAVLERLTTEAATPKADPQIVLRAIQRGARQQRDQNTRSDFDPGRLDATDTLRQVQSHAVEALEAIRRSARQSTELLRALAGLPQAKAVLLLSDRLPVRPGEWLAETWFGKYGEDYGNTLGINAPETVTEELDASPILQALAADAAAARARVYPLGTGASATRAAFSQIDAGRSNDGSINSSLALSSQIPSALGTRASDRQGLELLARSTGGRAAPDIGTSALLLAALPQELAAAYSLGFPSPTGGDGQIHRTEIRWQPPVAELEQAAARKDLRLAYPRAFRDRSAARQAVDQVLSTLYLGAGDNPLQAKVDLGNPKRREDGMVLLPLELTFPLSRLVLLPEDKVHRGTVGVILAVRDAEGGLSEPVEAKVPVEIPNEKLLSAMASHGRYRTELALRPTKQLLAVGVRDQIGATMSTFRMSLLQDQEGP